MDRQEPQVNPEHVEHPVPRVIADRLVPMAFLVSVVFQVYPDPKVKQVFPVDLALKEHQAARDLQALKVFLALAVLKVLKAIKDLSV